MVNKDTEIIQLFFKRDEKAIAELDKKYGAYCDKIARNILGNREDTEECVNEAYFKVWNSIPPKRPTMLKSYLGKITRNTAFDLYAKNTAEKRGGGQIELVLDELLEVVAGTSDVEMEIEGMELEKAINSFLESLSKENCVFFVRRYFYAESVAKIAKRYGVSQNYVSVKLNRLRKRLKEYLLEEYLLEGDLFGEKREFI